MGMKEENREEKFGRDSLSLIGRSFDKYYGQTKGVLELLESGLPQETRSNLQNARIMIFDGLSQLRTSVEEQVRQNIRNNK